ncbi:helix-turn-helix domain-containing protein [Massilia norwichensis]|jgi:transcriptional regulator with XRE-family HTH domain|uniref:helix-turn-helix domain-containing protein n=2 Tax=Massilia TaxID=149698 RepID=UPI0009FA36B9
MPAMTSTPEKNTEHRDPVCTAVGRTLKRLRISSKMSQEGLAFAAEVDRVFVSKIERGIANPSLLTLTSLCLALGVTLPDLLKDVDLSSVSRNGQRRRANSAQPVLKVQKGRLR